MAQQLIFSSAPRGYHPGASGYCTVAQSEHMRPGLIQLLEQASVYAHRTTAPHPEIYSYRTVVLTGTAYRIISRILAAGLDFTGRTNFIAHHLVFESDESLGSNSPAEILLFWEGWKDRWEGEPATLPPIEAIQVGRLEPPAKNWEDLVGDSAKAASPYAFSRGCWWISERYQEKQILTLMGESLRLNESEPELWSRSFTTYVGQILDPQQYNWKGWNGRDKRNDLGSKADELKLDSPNDMPSGPTAMQQLASSGLRQQERQQNNLIRHESVYAQGTSQSKGSFPQNYRRTGNKNYAKLREKPSSTKIIIAIGCLSLAAILASGVFFLLKINERKNTEKQIAFLNEINKAIKRGSKEILKLPPEIQEQNDQNYSNSWIRLQAICMAEPFSEEKRSELKSRAEKITKKNSNLESAVQAIVESYTIKLNDEEDKKRQQKEDQEKKDQEKLAEQKKSAEEVSLRKEESAKASVQSEHKIPPNISPKQMVISLIFKNITGIDIPSEIEDNLETFVVNETGDRVALFDKVKTVKQGGFLEQSWRDLKSNNYILNPTNDFFIFESDLPKINNVWITIKENKTNSLILIIPNGKTVEVLLTGKESESAGQIICGANELLGEESQILISNQVFNNESILNLSSDGIFDLIRTETKKNILKQIENKKKEISRIFSNTNLNPSFTNKINKEANLSNFEKINTFAEGWLEDGDIPSNKKSLRNKTNTLAAAELRTIETKNILIKRFPELETTNLSFSNFLLKAKVIINEKRSEFYLNPIEKPLNTIKKSEFNEKYRLNKTNEQDAIQIQKILNEIEEKQKIVSNADSLNELNVQIISKNSGAIPFTFIIKKSNP
jgi:hypothetical protein